MITDYRYYYTTYSQLKKENLDEYDCPKCGAKHSTKYYSHYERHVTSLSADALATIFKADIGVDTYDLCSMTEELYEDAILDIFRVKCLSCDTTHAILPGDIVPYRRYSLLSMFAIVKVMSNRSHSIEETANHLQLSWQYMINLLNQWISHLHGMALLMRSVYQERINEQAAEARERIIRFVCKNRDSFPQNYQKEHREIILMTHSQIHRDRKIALGMAVSQ